LLSILSATSRRSLLVALCAALLVTGLAAAPAQSAVVPELNTWAPAATAKIHPGVMMFTNGSQCTANFVFTDDTGAVYVGYAGHCATNGTNTTRCNTEPLPNGTPVTFADDSIAKQTPGTILGHGTLAYHSYTIMRANGITDANLCAYNDFALVKVDDADVAKVNPSVPFWGGPVGLDTTGTQMGDAIYTYGNSSIRAGVDQLSPHTGYSLGTGGAGWSHDVYTVLPGIPGDSGSGYLSENGAAIGTLSTLSLETPGANQLGDLAHELAFAQQYWNPSVRLVNGTEPFAPVL
jgi:hypothetical protein